MNSPVQPGPQAIELHFCQSCGISIPQPDIDIGRARAAPGGYVCAGCVYQQRDHDLVGERIVSQAAPRDDTGARILAAIALLYVVGATTFLLVRELDREPPVLDLGDVATVAQLQQVSRTVDGLDDETRGALATLQSNDGHLREDLREIGSRVGEVSNDTRQLSRSLLAEIESIRKAVVDVADRTLGLEGGQEKVMAELRGLRERAATAPSPSERPGAVVSDASEGRKPEPTPPARTKEEVEKERLLAEYTAKLKDRKASDQTRYNAAVQLGDLQHAGAVDPLVEALRKDGNDLVRRAAAWSLGMLGKHAVRAIPVLIEQIGGKQEYVGYMCERALGEITKAVRGELQTFNFDPTMSLSQRRKIQRQWEAWWKENRSGFLPGGA